MTIIRCAAALLSALLLAAATVAAAQPYPSKPIRFVVPFPMGGRPGSRRVGRSWGGDGAQPPGRWRRLKSLLVRTMAALALALCAAVAAAQPYPSKPIRFVVPFPPGGGNDIVGRIVAQRLHEALGETVVVDNRGGAGGTIGTDIVAKAPADGHTMLINNISLAVNATLFAKLPYDTLKDLAPVTLVGRQPNLVTVPPSLPVASVREFLALASAKPDGVVYGTGGIGTASHLATEMLQLMTGTKMVHVPYKGLGPALVDLMAGRVQMIISTMASALPLVKSGKLKALAVTTAQRSPFFPEVPTMQEAGVAGYEFSTWYALVVPAGTPQPVVARLNAELQKILALPAVRTQFSAQGLEPTPTSAAQARSHLQTEVEKWAKVIRASGAQAN